MVSATMFSSLTSKSSINFLYIGLNEPIENLMLCTNRYDWTQQIDAIIPVLI